MKYLPSFFLFFLSSLSAQVGIDTTEPKATLDINGNLVIRQVNNTSESGYVLFINDQKEVVSMSLDRLRELINQHDGQGGILEYNPVSCSKTNCDGSEIVDPSQAKAGDTICWVRLPYRVVEIEHKGKKDVSLGKRLWLDRNLGATREATSVNDQEAIGDHYQWGRFADGHQCRNSLTHSIVEQEIPYTSLPLKQKPWYGRFVIGAQSWGAFNNYDFYSKGWKNNPCPKGWSVPTKDEWIGVLQSENISNLTKAFESKLRLSMTGVRTFKGGSEIESQNASYWTKDAALHIGSQAINISTFVNVNDVRSQADGLAIRCIKDQ